MDFSKRKKRRAGILPALFVAATWKPALLNENAWILPSFRRDH